MTTHDFDASTRVQFFECSANNARELLNRIAAQQRASGAHVETLTSLDQPGLLLLLTRGGGEPDPLPASVRHWRFAHEEPETKHG